MILVEMQKQKKAELFLTLPLVFDDWIWIYLLEFFQWFVNWIRLKNSLRIFIYLYLNKKDVVAIYILT